MGKSKHIEKIRALFKKSPVIDFQSIKRTIGSGNDNYAKLLINNLLKSKEINKIAKGKYSLNEDPSLFVLCYNRSYLGLQSALSFHGLWEQETIPVVITPRKIRQGLRNVSGMNVLVRRIKKEYAFGFEFYNDGGVYLPYSYIEKTFIDMIVFNQFMDEDVLKQFKRRIGKNKLKKHLNKYPEKIRKRIFDAYSEIAESKAQHFSVQFLVQRNLC